jgi:hypothetical protein
VADRAVAVEATMTRRTRDTKWGLKTRFRKPRERPHGDIRRIVGDTPTVTLKQATVEALRRLTEAVPIDPETFDTLLAEGLIELDAMGPNGEITATVKPATLEALNRWRTS